MQTRNLIEQLYKEQSEQLIRQAESILHNHDEACDVVGEVFVELLHREKELQPETITGLLAISVRNRCLNIMKHQKAVKRAYKQWPSDSDNEAYEEKPVDEIMQYMHTNLTPQTQNVIQMRYNQKMRYNEIARELGISRIAVYKHLSQGIGKLRLRFNPTPFIIALMLLACIAYAAIHIYKRQQGTVTHQQKSTITPSFPTDAPSASTATIINFEDTELQDILQQIATHYHVRVVYTDEDVRHLRLHFVWDTTLPLSGVIALFNHFDRIHLSITDNEQTIIVE